MTTSSIHAQGRRNVVIVKGARARMGACIARGHGWREGLLMARTMRSLGYRFVIATTPRSMRERPRSSGRVFGPSLAPVAEATGGLPGGGGIFSEG